MHLSLCLSLLLLPPLPDADWPHVGNDKGGMRYSPLTQINRQNVKDLQVAWTYRTGDAGKGTTIECTPIVLEGVMYITSVRSKVIALDAATGRALWQFDPYKAVRNPQPIASGGVNRGVACWSDGKPNGARRILLGVADGRLISLDARTGRPDTAFGEGGEVDLRAGIERDLSGLPYGPTSAPALFENLVIVGFSCGEGPGPTAPGDVRAFDVRTGQEVWRFRTVPGPGEAGNETWEGESWRERGAANAWGGFTLDERRGIVFAGLGSAAFDFYGGDRKGDNLFANCTIALDARTGRRLWHFQTVRHDLWDRDLPCPPVVVTVRHNGRRREAVAQVTKTGYCFLLDRVTGKPLFGVQEIDAPPSDIPGEQAVPRQVVPVKPPPFSHQGFKDEDVTNRSPEAQESVRKQLQSLRYGSAYVPPSLQGSVISPGFHGGATWSGASFDPTTGILYVNSNNTPYVSRLIPTPSSPHAPFGFAGYTYFRDHEGYPAIKPPWGSLTAIDLNRGEFAWQITLGEHPELTARGLPPTGTENFGGTIVTAGGLVFIGGTMDEKFRAFDKATGKLLWEYRLPAGGYATPCTYAVNGRQYVVIAAGGGGKLGTKSGDAFVAFALPGDTPPENRRRLFGDRSLTRSLSRPLSVADGSSSAPGRTAVQSRRHGRPRAHRPSPAASGVSPDAPGAVVQSAPSPSPALSDDVPPRQIHRRPTRKSSCRRRLADSPPALRSSRLRRPATSDAPPAPRAHAARPGSSRPSSAIHARARSRSALDRHLSHTLGDGLSLSASASPPDPASFGGRFYSIPPHSALCPRRREVSAAGRGRCGTAGACVRAACRSVLTLGTEQAIL